MKIYFSPEYCGNVFMKADDNVSVFMDTMVVNTIGLINLLEFRLGIHLDEVSPHERIALYYDAMNKYIKENPENIFASSFNISGLSTAEIVLSWRDELSLANWNFNDKGISDRLDFIIGVEDYFRQIAYENNYADVCCDLSKRLSNIVDVIESSHKKFDDITLFLPCDKDLLRPFILTIIEVMESHGAKVYIVETAHDNDDNLSKVRKIISTNSKDKLTVGENDRSLLIWKFPDENLANEYFSYNDFKDVDVWINADNKQMDNWLRLMNRPMTGSIMKDCCPHLIQLFVTGISILGSSLNVNSLIEWLEMPVHPLDSSFRYKLAFDIANEGGYRNDKCRQDIKEYIEGKYVYDYRKVLTNEEQEKVNKGRKKREKYVKIFLPDFESKKNYSKEILTDFAKEISAWCGKKFTRCQKKEKICYG